MSVQFISDGDTAPRRSATRPSVDSSRAVRTGVVVALGTVATTYILSRFLHSAADDTALQRVRDQTETERGDDGSSEGSGTDQIDDLETNTAFSEGRSATELSELSTDDVSAEPPDPGELAVDDDVEDIVDEQRDDEHADDPA